jgi:GNAT superfamily N-acetyltransferase
MKIILMNEKDLEPIYKLLIELRVGLDFNEFLNIYQLAQKTGYQFYGALINQQLIGLMGARVLTDFVHGKHFYIDDLVVTQNQRGRGVGAQILAWAESYSLELDCRCLRLCTGVKAFDSQRFYENNLWEKRAVVFKKYH